MRTVIDESGGREKYFVDVKAEKEKQICESL